MNDSQKQINPYESPQAAGAKAGQRGVRINFPFVVAMLLTALLPVVVLLTRGRAIRLFEDFDVELPALTRFAVSWGFLLFTWGLSLFTLVKEFVLPPVMSTRLLNWMTGLTAIVLGAAYAFLVIAPIVNLIENLA